MSHHVGAAQATHADGRDRLDVQARAANKRAECHESLQESIRAVKEAQEVGALTLNTLHRQGEQLERVRVTLDQVESELQVGDRYLRSIGSVFGAFSNLFRTRPKPVQTKPLQSFRREVLSEGASIQADSRGLEPVEQVDSRKHDDFEPELSELSNGIAGLKAMALTMNNELDEHSVCIEAIDHSVSSADAHLNRAQHKIRRAL